MPKRRISERERRRLQTRRERYGEGYESRAASHAARFSATKFNSQTGSAAAKKRWADHREKKAQERNHGI